ncbi:MAG: hypothetical protein R2855_09760 [Thermomicrobiales bacterium]
MTIAMAMAWWASGPAQLDQRIQRHDCNVAAGLARPGVASFTSLANGAYTVGASLADRPSISAYCSDDAFVEVPSAFDDATGTLALDLTGGCVVTCDWYVTPIPVEPAYSTTLPSKSTRSSACPVPISTRFHDTCHGDGIGGSRCRSGPKAVLPAKGNSGAPGSWPRGDRFFRPGRGEAGLIVEAFYSPVADLSSAAVVAPVARWPDSG